MVQQPEPDRSLKLVEDAIAQPESADVNPIRPFALSTHDIGSPKTVTNTAPLCRMLLRGSTPAGSPAAKENARVIDLTFRNVVSATLKHRPVPLTDLHTKVDSVCHFVVSVPVHPNRVRPLVEASIARPNTVALTEPVAGKLRR